MKRARNKTGTFSGRPALEHRKNAAGEEEYKCTVCAQFFPLLEFSKSMCQKCRQAKHEAEAKVRAAAELRERGRSNATAHERGRFSFRKNSA